VVARRTRRLPLVAALCVLLVAGAGLIFLFFLAVIVFRF
jgi:hypothetical protein